ncbi:MAG TPA: methyltransferase domain-containing protein [Bacteroidia bacterium]|nr:methyltransferase domain-containing protein [Bacteroidia bacterium]
MNWEETIQYARKQDAYQALIRQCYLTDDLLWNTKAYGASEEFREIVQIIRKYAPEARNLIEFGAGNGIASLNFALEGYTVLSTEPDTSDTVGSGAIKKTAALLGLGNISVLESYAENINEADNQYDIVFARQCMHHANDLEAFTKNAYRMLKPGGLFLAVRDHVINSENNRQEFLKTHAFHKYYGGENAFTLNEYKSAIIKAGFRIEKVMGYFDSVINFFPEINPLEKVVAERNALLKKKFGVLSKPGITKNILIKLFEHKYGKANNDSNIVGRMYSFVAIK